MIIYTAVIGTRHSLQPIKHRGDCRFVCFTDRPKLASLGWELQLVDPGTCPETEARYYKTHPFEALDTDDPTLWVDADLRILQDLGAASEDWPQFAALKHPKRSSIESEALAIVRQGMAPARAVYDQVAQYRAEGFLAESLTSGGFLFRRRTMGVKLFNQRWWEAYLEAGHTRDQMSLDYALWRAALTPHYLEGSYLGGPYVNLAKG